MFSHPVHIHTSLKCLLFDLLQSYKSILLFSHEKDILGIFYTGGNFITFLQLFINVKSKVILKR